MLHLIAPLLLLIPLVLFFRTFGSRKKKNTYDQAILRGIAVTEVDRDVPINDFSSLKKMKIARYALPRLVRGDSWEMLMRDKKSGAQLLDFYLVKSKEVTPQLLDALRPVAENFTEGYFEFEGTDKDVAIFLEGWGEDIDLIYNTLVTLQNI